jgi:hypothetical protein
LYLQRFYGRIVERSTRLLRNALERRLARRGSRVMHDFADLGELTEAPRLECAEEGVLLEWSVTPNFSLAAGSLIEGRASCLSARSWSWLFAGRYFVRAVRRSDLSCLRAWTFVKTTRARAWPVDPESFVRGELPQYRRVDGDEVQPWH